MSKMWIDPAAGWQYGFPAIWDSEVDGDVYQWMLDKGLPEDLAFLPCRVWDVTEDINNSEIVLRD